MSTLILDTETRKTADLSDDGVYRYALTREWDDEAPRLLFVMLNPSTADANRDDQTIKRCIFYARREGYGSIEVVNLYAYRTVNPAVLKRRYREGVDVIGRGTNGPASDFDRNRRTIIAALQRADQVVVAWGGAHKPFIEGEEFAMRLLLEGQGWRPLCLGHTADASPRHPSRLGNEVALVPWLVMA